LKATMSFSDYLQSRARLIDDVLGEVFPPHWDMPPTLRSAMNYSLMGGGKRLRAILTLAAAEAVGCPEERALPAACAIEMVHTYSLIHDDLPAMDNDDFRRGKPTNHKVYGEAMAILAGDALLTHAFYCIVQCSRRYGLAPEQTLAIVEELAEYAGARGMVGGQAADIEGEQGVTGLDQLMSIHDRKTGDLIVFSLRAGARIAGANDRQLAALTEYGRKLGLAFQIQDDILDVTGDESKLGKPVKSDEKKKKVTYPFFLGLEKSRNKVRELTEESKRALKSVPFANPDRLLELADFLMDRDR